MKSLPLGLRSVLESGNCVLFVGAGVGAHMLRPDGESAPDAAELAQGMAKHFNIETSSKDLSKVAQLVELRKGRRALDDFLRKSLEDLTPDETLIWLTTFRWRAIFTTNYDRSIERAYDLNSSVTQTPVSISVTSDLRYCDPRSEVPLFHLHGTLYGDGASHVVITERDYSAYKAQRTMIWDRLRSEFATSTFLYVGYSGRDHNWRLVLDELTEEFAPTPIPHSYRVDPFTDDIDIEILSARQIDTLEMDLSGFRVLVDQELQGYRPSPDALTKYQGTVPIDLRESFEDNPVAMMRLLASWEYIQGANFAAEANINDFLRGDRPNWPLIANGSPFTRDAEADIWDDILEFATAPGAKSKALALTAPAGWGVTTLLMTLASRVVKARIGPAFMLRPNASVIEGDVNYAASLFPDVASFFFVDFTREQAAALDTSLYQQRQTNRNCLFVMGARRNEWNSSRVKLKVQEYALDVLSDNEIDNLLDYLEKENALGKLADLDRPYRFSIVREKHEKQLLIAMREAVEGTNFDAIIEDEYRKIVDSEEPDAGFSRELYLLVSCFYQHGLVIRDELAANIASTPLAEIYLRTGHSLDGIVQYEELDSIRGEYGYRTRHRIIADVVWKRCGNQAVKERILQAAIEKLNLLFKLDRLVFDKLVKSDAMIATFTTIDSKIRFFETATKRDPQNVFVLQHYARMLLREDRLALALGQIDAAIKMRPEPHVLHHTRGLILSRLASEADSEEVGRKWLLQAEQEFRKCINHRDEDGYSYTSLARSYLEWAKRCKSTEEATEYITKCETVVAEGLRAVKERQSLWIVSSEIQQWLGNEPARLAKLRSAVTEAKSGNIARYLLGRAYRQDEQYDRAIEVLEPIIRTEFSEFRVFIEYARALMGQRTPWAKCLAVLSQSRVDGLSDPIYVGLLGGLYFLNGETSEAENIFLESKRQAFTAQEAKRVQFRPRSLVAPHDFLTMEGTIATVRPGFVFLRNDSGQELYSRDTRFKDRILQKGDRVTFTVAFSASGAVGEIVSMP